MDVQNRIPLFFGHIEDHAVTQDARVVDQDVELAKRVDGAFDNTLGTFEIRYALEIRNGFAACGFDFIDHLLSWAVI